VSAVEVKTERDEAIPLRKGDYKGPVVRVRCRYVGTRRWTTFLLVPDEEFDIEELEDNAEYAAESYLASRSTNSHPGSDA
jgi:hypothetical protein